MIRLVLAVAAISLIAASPTVAQQGKLEGDYRIGSKTVTDPPRGEKKDRVYLWISGKAARDIYNRMSAKPVLTCYTEDVWSKRAGDLECWKTAGIADVTCSVAVTLDRGRTAAGSVC